ncbi:MAG: Fumarate hydratase, alpha subunit [candidate division TA06 bacterium 32_111]|jgi:fumarate hydratase subunit alpha|nr:MAG: Fumarate hydratase, alpha subunit [candidate division TA06 bacterium 32_111]
MRKIKTTKITDKVRELFLEANYHIESDVLDVLRNAVEKEQSSVGKDVLNMIIKNNQNLLY